MDQSYESNSLIESQVSINDNEFYKQQLFENFKQTGVLDNIKATLRKQLVDKFQEKKQPEDEKKEEEEEQHKDTRFHYERQLVGYMIADFFRKHNINYTYSVFLPEMRLESDNILTKDEILDALRVQKHEYQNIINTKQDLDLSALEIMMEVIRQIKTTPKREVHCQTEYEFDKNFKEKIDDLEDDTKKKMDKINVSSTKLYEEKLLKYKSEMEKRYQEQLEDEIQKVRDYELAEIRSQEADLFQQKIRKHKYEMDKMYEEKLVRLKERERTALELCKRRQSDLDKVAFEYRQTHIKELDKLKEQELEMRKHNCMENQDIKKEQEKMKQLEKSLKMKIREYDQAKLTIQTRIEQDINSRKKLMKKEMDIDRSGGLNLTVSNQEQELRKQHRENLSMLETQRQYLQRDLDAQRKDNKELEYIRQEQSKEIEALRKTVNLTKESGDSYQERVKQSEDRSHKLEQENIRLQEYIRDLQNQVDSKQTQQVELHRKFSVDIQKYQKKANESEQNHYTKIQEIGEKHKYEVQGFLNRTRRLEEQVQLMERENDDLRTQLRFIRRQENIQENKENLDERYNKTERIRDDLEQVGDDEYKANIGNLRKEYQDYKDQYLKDLEFSQNFDKKQ